MALPYWTDEDLVARVGIDAALAALDRDNSGAPDADAIVRLQRDCDAQVEGYLRGGYDLDVVRATPPEQVKRLSLDLAEARIWRMAPSHARADWAELTQITTKELEGIRNGRARLDVVGAPEPPANVGGIILAPAGDLLEVETSVFLGGCHGGGMGDF